MVVVQLLSMLPVVSTARCVAESLAIRLEAQMPLALGPFHSLTPTMSMESVSLMAHLAATYGLTLLVYQKESIMILYSNKTTAHAATPAILTMYIHHRLLETTTIVNPAIQQTHLYRTTSIVKIHSGMVRSVKASVAAMENLPRGSVWSYQAQQLMILRCEFAVEKGTIEMRL